MIDPPSFNPAPSSLSLSFQLPPFNSFQLLPSSFFQLFQLLPAFAFPSILLDATEETYKSLLTFELLLLLLKNPPPMA
jgi:hypothetical protein